MNKKKKIIISLIIIGLVILGISFTLTYFRSNFSTSKKIATDIFRATYTSTLEEPDSWIPGSVATGNFKVKNETNLSVAVRAKIEEHWYDSSDNELSTQVNNQDVANKTIGTGWGLYDGYYYYYKTLDTQNEETTNFIPQVEFANIFNGTDCTTNNNGTKTCAYGGEYALGKYSLIVTFEVIQADAYETEWAANITDEDNIDYGNKITFNAGDGSVNVAYKYVNTNNEIGQMPTAIRTGYTFAGWYTNTTDGDLITNQTKINSNTTIYARWFEQYNPYLKGAYVYNEDTCQTGRENTCQVAVCMLNNTNCPAGTIVDYQVDSTTTNNTQPESGQFPTSGIMRFHVLKDNGNVIEMQSQKNVVTGVAWHANENDNSQGPDTIVSALETATNGWNNVITLNTTYNGLTSGCAGSSGIPICNQQKYFDYTTGNANKARLISLNEATTIGECRAWISNEQTNVGTCAKWMTNYLYNHGTCNNIYYDSTSGNYGYWTSSAYGSGSSWTVYYGCNLGSVDTSYLAHGARAVVNIYKRPSNGIANPNQYIKAAYKYEEGKCEENDRQQTGESTYYTDNCEITTCIYDNSESCPKGTIIDYQVDATTTDNTLNMAGNTGILRFHVLYDNGSTMVLQMNKNLASLNGTRWYSGGNDSTKGPATILPALESATSGWTNVNNQTYTLGTDVFGTGEYATAKVGCIGQTGPVTATKCNYDTYTSETIDANLGGLARTAKKARLITANEAGEMGCQIWVNASCPKWMFNYLNYYANGNATFYPVNESGSATELAGNYSYWTSSARSGSTTGAWHVSRYGDVSDVNASDPSRGARPVIVINK